MSKRLKEAETFNFERIRTAMQNHHAGMAYTIGTPEDRAAHIEQEKSRYLAALERSKGVHWQ